MFTGSSQPRFRISRQHKRRQSESEFRDLHHTCRCASARSTEPLTKPDAATKLKPGKTATITDTPDGKNLGPGQKPEAGKEGVECRSCYMLPGKQDLDQPPGSPLPGLPIACIIGIDRESVVRDRELEALASQCRIFSRPPRNLLGTKNGAKNQKQDRSWPLSDAYLIDL